MSSPEFFGPGVTGPGIPQDDGLGGPAEPSAALREAGPAAVAAGSAVLWLLACAASVVASFQTVYGIDFANGTAPDRTVDGWGRYSASPTAVSGVYGSRFGVVLVAVAAAFVLAAALTALATTRFAGAGAARRAVGIGGIAATGVLLGTVASAALEAKSELDSFRAEIHLELLDTSERSAAAVNFHTYYGPLLWWGLAASACAALAAALPRLAPWVPHVARIARRPAGRVVAPPPDHHSDDETLDGRWMGGSGIVS